MAQPPPIITPVSTSPHLDNIDPSARQHPPQGRPPQLTPLEQRVLRECQSESFWYASLPYAGIFALATSAGVRAGYLKPSPTRGPWPKVALATVFGYFMGKFSYANTCADKFLVQAPDSSISDTIRRRRGLPPREGGEFDAAGEAEAPPGGFGELGPGPVAGEETTQGAGGTYEALRKQNREQFESAKVQTRAPHTEQQPLFRAPPEPLYREPPQDYVPSKIRRPASTNKYGDEGFE